MQYHFKYAFFEIFSILESNFPKNYSIIFFVVEKTAFNPVLNDF